MNFSMKALQFLLYLFFAFSVGAQPPPFTVLGYFGSSQNINVSVMNHTVAWLEASQNCFSYHFLELFAESSVDKLLEHLLNVNHLLQQLLWPTDKYLWIGYLNNGNSYLMVNGGKCVASADLLQVFYTNRTTGCVLLNVAATTASELLYTVPCDEQHEYLCESPIRVDINSTRYENMIINELSVFGYVPIPLLWSTSTKCEQEMKSRKLAYAAVFHRMYFTCDVYESLLYEFPVNIQIETTILPVTTFVKTAGVIVTIRQKNEMQASHTNLIQNCFPPEPNTYANTKTLSSSLTRTSAMTSAIQTVEVTEKTTQEIPMKTTDVSPTMQTEETTMIITEIPFQTSEELTIKMTDEMSTISTTEELTTLKLGETGIAAQEITPTKETTTDHTDGVLCSSNCCTRLPDPLNNSFVGDMVLVNIRVNKTHLSSYKRKRTSVKDARLSSAVIGYCATVILIAACLIIIIPDLFRMVKFDKICKQHKQQKASVE